MARLSIVSAVVLLGGCGVAELEQDLEDDALDSSEAPLSGAGSCRFAQQYDAGNTVSGSVGICAGPSVTQ